MKWSIEDATSLDEVSEGFIDGWDAINVRISNDNGNSWAILESSNDPYDFFSGYGWLHNGETPGQSGVNSLASGWSGDSDWHQVKFDLSEYVDQNVIIRFAFGSDPAYSTYGTDGTDSNPIPSLTGLFIDDIKVSSSNEVLFSANAEVHSEDVMISSGSSWLNWFYGSYGKYCLDNNGNILNVDDENACVAIDGSWFVEPGSEGWEPYYLLDFTPFMGTDIRFRFASVYDDNNDGGSGKGLFFDDFVIYRQNLLSDINVLIDPISFSAESKNGNVHLSWYDVSQSGDSTFVFDNNDSTKFGSILIESQESNEIASAGIVFPAWLGESNIKSIYLYNETDGDKTVSISGYGIKNNEAPSLIEPVFIKEDIVLSNLGWNKILLLDWEFPSLFILSQKFSKVTSIPYDPTVESSSLQYLVEDGINWELFPSIGSWCIRSDVEYQGIEGVNYNLFRKVLQSNSESEVQIANNVVGGVFIDTDVENNAIYQYRIEQVFANNIITQDTLSVTVLPKSVYDLPVYDDGSFESELALLENDSIAVFYKNDRDSQSIAQFKWYQNGSGGYFRFLVWDDDNGIPGNLIKSVLMSSISYEKTNGWNIVNLANKNIQVSSDFWIGIEASSDLRPIGLDTSIDLEVSKIKSQNNSWESVGGNIGFQVSLDCNDDCPDSLSLNSVSNPIKYEISQIYPNPFNPNVNIKYKISKLSKVELSIYDLNGRMVNKLVDDILLPGSHTSTWESIGISGKKVSSGLYFVELKVGGNTAGFTKMVLIK